jgi:hypothetical protein
MRTGYAFELPEHGQWRNSPDELWETVVVGESDVAGAVQCGTRFIDGSRCRVFQTTDGRAIAQVAVG